MVEIVDNGWKFVFESTSEIVCDGCVIGDYGPHVGEVACRLCGGTRESKGQCLICTSAQKITEEAKVYFAWNRMDANDLVGKIVEAHNGLVTCGGPSDWYKTVLVSVDNTGSPFYTEKGNVPMIREIKQRRLTWPQIQALHDDLSDVVLVEGD